MTKISIVTLAVLVALAATATAGVTPTFYGYIKLDASLDSAMTDAGDYAYIVLPYADGEEDDEFNMTAKQTRLGMKLQGPDADNVELSGLVEFDLYGGGAENKPNPMLRHAYLVMKFPAVEVLAGQTWDLIAPLNPSTLNYIVLWKSGNIGYRRPQIRLSKTMKLAEGAKVMAAASINRNMGLNEDGEDSGMPSFQGRLAFGKKIVGGTATLGVSGVWGQQESDDFDTDFDRTGVAVDLSLPLGPMVSVKGEYFTGKNLGVHLGGIGQSIAEVEMVEETRVIEPSEIEASGWWGQLTVRPVEALQFNVGAGSDDPELPSGDTANELEKNTTYFGNVIWTVAPAASIGFEYAMHETEYLLEGGETESYENNRMQLSFMYKF